MTEKVFIRNVSDELWRNLKASAAERGLTISKAVSEAIEQWLVADTAECARFDWKRITALGKSRKEAPDNVNMELSNAIFKRKLQ